MGFASSISRLTEYYKRHGLAETVRRAALGAQRTLFANRFVVFCCDLSKHVPAPPELPAFVRIERIRRDAELSRQDTEAITSFWNPDLVLRNIHERFKEGASLWVIRIDERLAGFGWSLQGATMEPYFFPLRPEDVHLFDFHVLSEFRGRGLNPLLVAGILVVLAADGSCRAFIEAAEWNTAQLASLKKTPFRRLGMVRSFRILGRTFTQWSGRQAGDADVLSSDPVASAPAVARPHQQ